MLSSTTINARSNNRTTKTTYDGGDVVNGVSWAVNLLPPRRRRRRRILQSISAAVVVDGDDEMTVILALAVSVFVSVAAATMAHCHSVGVVVGVCYDYWRRLPCISELTVKSVRPND